MPAPETITLVRGDEVTDVPVSDAHAWISEGFAPETDDARTQRVSTQAKSDAYSSIDAAYTGGLSALTLGGSDILLSGLGGEDAKRQLSDIKKAAPVGSVLGNVVGSIAPALVSGGGSLWAATPEAAALAASRAFTPAGAVMNLGAKVVGLGEKSGFAGKSAALLGAGAVEGGISNIGQYLADVAIGDKELAADGFTAAVGQGTLFGAVGAGVFGTGAKALKTARGLFPKSEVTKQAVQQLETEAAQAVRSASDDAKAMKQAATDRLRQIREERAALDLTTKTELDAIAKSKARELADLELASARAKSEALVARADTAKSKAKLAEERALNPKKGKRKAFADEPTPTPTPAPPPALDETALAPVVDDAVPAPVAPAPAPEPVISGAVDAPPVAPDAAPTAPVRQAFEGADPPMPLADESKRLTPDEFDPPEWAEEVTDGMETVVDPTSLAGRDIYWGDDFGRDTVKLNKARKAISDGQQTPVQISVSPGGKYHIDDGRHRLKAAIDAGIPVKVKWFKGSKGLDDLPSSIVDDVATKPLASDEVKSVLGKAPDPAPAPTPAQPAAPAQPRDPKTRVEAVIVGRPSQGNFELRVFRGGSEVPEISQIKGDDLLRIAEDLIPDGFRPGLLSTSQDLNIIPGMPKGVDDIVPNALYVVRPSEVVERGVMGNELNPHRFKSVGEAWDQGKKLPPMRIEMSPDGRMFIEDGNHRLQNAALTDRPVAIEFRKMPGKPQAGARDITDRIREKLPKPGELPAAPAPTIPRTLEEQLAATKQALDEGASLKQVGASREEAIEEAMNRHIAKSDPEAQVLISKLDEMKEGQTALDAWLAKHPKGKVRAFEYADGMRKKSGYASVTPDGEGSAGLPRGRSSEWRGSLKDEDEAIGRFYDRQGGEDALAASTKRWYPGDGTPEGMMRMADGDLEAQVSRALKGATDDIELDLDDVISQLGRYETASADLADALGQAAPPGAAGRAKALREAQSASERKAADATAGAVEDIEKAGAVAAGSKAGGIVEKLADAGGIMEALSMMGVSMPDVSKIPVIGPLLSIVLKARMASKVFRRIGGKVPETAEGQIARRAAQTRDKVIKAVDQIVDGASKAVRKAALPAANATAILGHKLFDDDDPMAKPKKSASTGGTLQQMYLARSEELDRAMQPNAIRAAIRARVRADDPEIVDQIVASHERKLQFIDSKRPRADTPPGLLAPKVPFIPSKVEVQQWSRYVEAAENPTLILERAAAGLTVSPEAAETLKTVYPRLFQEAQRRLIERAADMDATLPYARRVELSGLFDVPLDATMDPAYTSFLQEGYQAAPPPTSPQGPVMTPTIMSDMNQGMRAALPFDQGA